MMQGYLIKYFNFKLLFIKNTALLYNYFKIKIIKKEKRPVIRAGPNPGKKIKKVSGLSLTRASMHRRSDHGAN
jgi:uncharacterized Zn finger protein